MGHSSPEHRLVLDLSLCEAMTVMAALRQYEPYWHDVDAPEGRGEQLAHVREDVMAVLDKLRSSAQLPA